MSIASSMRSDDVEPTLTSFDYMYRDAGNFKAHGSIVVLGKISPRDRQKILRSMEAEEFFVAEQVGIPPLYEDLFRWSGGMTRSDHAWHSFVGLHDVDAAEERPEPIWGSACALIDAFAAVEEWDDRLSSNFNGLLTNSLRP